MFTTVNMMKKVLYLIVPNNMFIYMLDNRPTNLTVVHLRKKKKNTENIILTGTSRFISYTVKKIKVNLKKKKKRVHTHLSLNFVYWCLKDNKSAYYIKLSEWKKL